ncbi:MAG: hypothetical protein FWE90_06720 [Defluviitaleaceae bacterium]|nr:hypothetical protein [Defluviitaleaceae bacterium]
MFYEEECNNDHKPECHEVKACEHTTCKMFDVSLPVTIKPYVTPEEPEVICAGTTEVRKGRTHCEGDPCGFEFTITRKLLVQIPIKFGAKVCYDNACLVDDGECPREA